MAIVILDYGMGNLGSIQNMLQYLGEDAVITSELSVIEKADKLILPGVGSFDAGMAQLESAGMMGLLKEMVDNQKKPILGICLGMQLMTKGSEEGKSEGLGWLDASTHKFDFSQESGLRVPHMGWNHISVTRAHELVADLDEEPRYYFVHSYYISANNPADVIATASHGHTFVAIMSKDNIMGCQFHPEKSHRYGMMLLKNFAKI